MLGLSQAQYLMTNPRATLEKQIAEAEAKVKSRLTFTKPYLETRVNGKMSKEQNQA